MRHDKSSKFPFSVPPISSAGDGGCTASIRACSSTTATLWWRRSIAGRSECFRLPSWKSKPTTKEESKPSNAATMNGRSITKCRLSRSCRFGWPDCRASIPTHGRRAALEIEMDGTCWELDEAGEPPALGFARLLKREDPDVILSEWGDSTILPLLRQQAERLKFSLTLNRDESASVQQSRGTQLHELRKDTFQSERNNALWPYPRGQAEFVHFGEVRFCRSLGTGPRHQTSDSIRCANNDRDRHFLHADGTRPPRRRADSRAESGARRSQSNPTNCWPRTAAVSFSCRNSASPRMSRNSIL